MGVQTMDTEARIKARISGREYALSSYDLLFLSDGTPPWEDQTGADFAESFLDELRLRLPQRAKPQQDEPPPPVPIARLGATVMPFGMHQDKPFDEVPLDYLGWLCGSTEDLLKSLRAYLKHPELEARRGGQHD